MATLKLIRAKASFVPTSPRKLRLVMDALRNLSLSKALDQVRSLPQTAAGPIQRVLEQAVGNAKNNFSLSPDSLSIESMQIEEGPRYKRRDAHAHGARFDSGLRRRRTSHIIVTLKSAVTK